MNLKIFRWTNWTLKAQVTCVILFVVIAFETASVGLDYIQIRNGFRAEIENRGDVFLSEALPALLSSSSDQRSAVAKRFKSSERMLRFGEQAVVTHQEQNRLHAAVSQALQDNFREEGFEIHELLVTDSKILISNDDDFANFLNSVLLAAKSDASNGKPVPANIAIISVKLTDVPDWFNFYILTAPISVFPLLLAASVDTAIAVVFTMVMIAIVRHILNPMQALAEGADRLGRGEKIEALEPEGAKDVRQTVLAFNRMSARVRQAYDYQSSLIQSLGHDLRGPLDRVRRLAKKTSSESIRDELILRVDSVDDIVTSVTSFTRATRHDGALAKIDLPSLLDALVEEQKDFGNLCTLDVKASVTVKGRHTALLRVFRNLIENAIKYGTSAHITLERNDTLAVVTVDDKGKGIATDQLETAFRPFERLEAEGRGSGLGLAIVKAIVVDHGGEIELSNLQPNGLRATVRLPLDPDEINRA